MKIRNLTLSLLLAPCLAGAAIAHDSGHFTAGEPGDPTKPAREITVVMKEAEGNTMIYEPARLTFAKGEQIRFLLINAGDFTHEFMLASMAENDKHATLMEKYPDMVHDDVNGRTLKPNTRGELLWKFSKSGTFQFACLIPGHREYGMLGSVTVK